MPAGDKGGAVASPPETSIGRRDGRARAPGRLRGGGWLLPAAGLGASIPIVVTIAHYLSVDWAPLGDDAAIALRSFDVLTDRSPLAGLPSTGPTGVLDEQAYHLGPLLFWLLALPVRLPDPSALVVTIGLVNIAAAVGVLALARRRGGLPLMFAAAVALPLMLASLPSDALSDVWNPAAALMPFTLLIFVAWSLACGDHRLLPLAVLLASFASQCHLTYVFPAAGALAVGIVGLALERRRAGRRGRSRRGAAPGGVRRWVLAALAVAVACWIAPLIDLVTGDPGNLVRLWDAAMADQPGLGAQRGLRALAFSLGVPPWWLRDPRVAIERVSDLDVAPDLTLVASALMVLGGLAATTLLGYRRRRDDVSAAGALALVLCLAIVQFTLSVPVASFAAVGYGLWWASPVGMFAWLVLGWSLATLFVPVARLRSWAPLARHAGRLPALGAAAAIATGALVGMGAAWREEPYEEMRSIADRLEATLPERATRVDVSAEEASFFGLDLQTGTVNALRRQGRDDVTAPNIEESLGPDYGGDGAEPEQVVGVYVDSAPPARARVLFRRRLVDSPEPGDPFAAEARARLVSLALAAARERR